METKAPQQFPTLESLTRPTVDTAAFAHYMHIAPQTSRIHACKAHAYRFTWLPAHVFYIKRARMTDKDLADVLRALTHLSEAIDELGKKLPPALTARLLKSQLGLSAAIMSIAKRHESKPVEFSEKNDGCVEFITNIPFVLNDSVGSGEEADNLSVAQSRPTPPRPKTVKK